jgi:hypothetical protein
VDELAVVTLDLDGYRETRMFMYVLPIGHYDMILGMPWITAQDATVNGPRSEMRIGATGTIVKSKEAFSGMSRNFHSVQVSAAVSNVIRVFTNQKQERIHRGFRGKHG